MEGKSFSKEIKIAAGQFVREKEYWINQLSGEIEMCYFPYDNYKELVEEEYRKNAVTFKIRGDVYTRLMEITGGSYPKIHMVLVACTATLSARYTGNRHMIVGTSIERQDTEELLINTILPIMVSIPVQITFKELIIEIRKTINEAIENQNYPIETLTSQQARLIDVVVLLENIQERKYVEHLQAAIQFIFRATDKEVEGELEYHNSKYEKESIIRIINHFLRLMHVALFDVNVKVSDTELLSEAEKKELSRFNYTRTQYPHQKTIHELFEEQVEKTPDNISVVDEDQGSPRQITYRELNEKSNQLAKCLKQKGIDQGNIVGIMMERSIEMITGIMGILKAGGIYLPLDPDYPPERIDYILKDSGAKLLVTTRNKEGGKVGSWEGEIYYIEELIRSSYPLTLSPSSSAVKNLLPATSHLRPTSSLAYIIYTSGSTGKPKGVLVPHRGVVNYICWAARTYVKDEPVNFPLYTSIAFDLTVTSIFTPLITGNAIIVYGRGTNQSLIEDIIDNDRVEAIKLTPSHLKLLRNKKLAGKGARIKRLILGGEDLEASTAREIHEKFHGDIEIYNEYGPTEATVGCMNHKFDPENDNRISVPIGIPIANSQVYLLNDRMDPIPVGAKGELYISGDGIAAGYLNRPQLTEEKFISNPFMPGMKMYRTGDLGRRLLGGNIEFSGRIDDQVKIRGYRIETGEIESRLAKHPGIKESVVLKRKEGGDEYLCAYIVSAGDFAPSELRGYLSKKLPDYMIPSYFVKVEKIPLTPNGKIDRRALPGPEGISLRDDIDYIPPSSALEKKLVEIWEQVLGRSYIGVNENFFMLGGDSIKSIQIISRINSAGYKLQMRDLFQYPVISDLALHLKELEHIPDQAPVMGVVPLTPIQAWFFDKHRIDIHHFNQSVMFYSRDGLDEDAIKAVFTKIQEHHDVLRMTYKEENGEVAQIDHGLNYPLSLQVFDLRNRENSMERLEIPVNEIQAGIHLETGPLMKLGFFHLDDGDRLLIVIHHLVIDGVSWRILFEDIEALYQQYKKGEPLTLPLKTDSFKVWAEKLSDYANSETFLKEKTYWTELESTNIPSLGKDFDEPGNYRKDEAALSFILSEQETDDLLTKVNDAFGTAIDDILLTALGMGIKKSWGHNPVLVSLEGHGREEILEGIDISRTLGWFTSSYPLVMDISYEDDPGRQIKEVKEAIRKVPNKGIGYGILKYITGAEHKKDLRFQLKPQFGFNYLGQFDSEIGQISFEMANELVGNTMSSEGERELDFDILGMIANNRLGITVTYNKKHYKLETMKELENHIRKELKHVIAFCCSKENTERTPSDFTYKGLSIEMVDRLTKEYPGIENIYTLTPMQEGMLFYALVDESSYSYFEQTSYRLQGKLDIKLLEKSLDELFKRHNILQTAFVYQNIKRPVQLVLRDRDIDFYYEDISKIGEKEERERVIREFKAKDKKRGFDLTKGSLMRVSILQVDKSEYEFIWSFHHILMDGWCVGILNTEFFEIYTSYLENEPYRLPAVKPYRTYIQWLEKQDKDEAAEYWQNYLDSFGEQTGVPVTRRLTKEENQTVYRNEMFSVVLDMEKTAGLNKLAAENHVTLSTVTQTLWGILLGKYNGKEDVVFGAVVSGRPSGLEGVESMVGLFINTIPVRISFEEKMKFSLLLQQVQEEALASEPYHYNSLAEIQSVSSLKQNLIDHLFIFENYPIAEQIEIEGYRIGKNRSNKTSLKLANVEVFEQTNYDFNIILGGSDRLKIKIQYNGNVYEGGIVEMITKHLTFLVDQVIENQELEIGKLMLLLESEEEKQLLKAIIPGTEEEFQKNGEYSGQLTGTSEAEFNF